MVLTEVPHPKLWQRYQTFFAFTQAIVDWSTLIRMSPYLENQSVTRVFRVSNKAKSPSRNNTFFSLFFISKLVLFLSVLLGHLIHSFDVTKQKFVN